MQVNHQPSDIKGAPLVSYQCLNCGGTMVGDNYTSASHCENAEVPDGAEADSGPYYCNFPYEKEES